MHTRTRTTGILAALAVVAALFGTLADPVAAKTGSVDARLGGARASFKQKYGTATGRDEKTPCLGFRITGYGSVVAFDAQGGHAAVGVTLTAARAAHAPTAAADPADWTAAKARRLAKRFLPDDASFVGEPRNTGDGRKEGGCRSAALGAAFDKAAWKRLHAGGKPGDCHYLLSPDAAGNVYQIEVGVGRSGSLDGPAPTAVPTRKAPASAPAVPTSVQPASYTMYSDEQIDTPNQRRRWVLRVAMDPNAGRDALVAGIADAVRHERASHEDGVCIIVFVSSAPDADLGADVGRGFLSTDGKGLSGDGQGLVAPDDNGEIQIDIGSGVIYVSP